MSPKQARYLILLDEMLPAREKFPELNNSHNVRHLVHDFHKLGLEDKKVILLAKKENRIIITKNTRHFFQECKDLGVTLIGVTEEMPAEEIDKDIMAKLRRISHNETYIKISKKPRKK